MMENVIKALIERGYPQAAAKIVAGKLSNLSGELKAAADLWLESGQVTVVDSNGYSTQSLMARFPGMTYPAAVLTIDWLKREPEKAIKSIEGGIR